MLGWEVLKMLLASATEMRHFSEMSMLTLTPAAARGNLSELLRRALKGDDIGIVVDGSFGPQPRLSSPIPRRRRISGQVAHYCITVFPHFRQLHATDG
jgi:hypothetical protein